MADTTNVGAIAVEILAKTEKLEQGMAKAAKSVDVFAGTVAGIAAGVTNFFLNMGRDAVNSMTGLVSKTLEEAQALNDLSVRVQASVTDLMALGAAANKSGSSAETLNDSMDKFVKTLGGAEESANGGSAAKAIQMLGLSMKDLQLNDKAEAMAVVAQRLATIGNVTQRAFIETSLFGKSGQQLDGTLRQLAESGLDGVVKSALKTGEALNGVDVQKLVMAQESVETLNGIFKGLANTIAVKVAPYIAYLTDQIIDFVDANGGLGPVVSKAFGYLNEAIGWVINSMYLLKAGWFGFQAVVNTVVDFVVAGPLRAIAYAIDTIFVSFQNSINAMIAGYNKLQNLGAAAQVAYAEAQQQAARGRGDKDAVSYYGQLKRLAEQDMNKNAIQPLSVVDTGLSNFMDKFHDELTKNAEEGSKAYTENMEAWLKGKGHDEWIDFTTGIANEFTKKAKLRADAADEALKNNKMVPGANNELVKTGFGLQLDTSRVSVEALRMAEKKVQKVEDPQLAETNGLLGKLVKVSTAKPTARTAS